MASAMVVITYLQDEVIKKGNALLMFFLRPWSMHNTMEHFNRRFLRFVTNSGHSLLI